MEVPLELTLPVSFPRRAEEAGVENGRKHRGQPVGPRASIDFRRYSGSMKSCILPVRAPRALKQMIPNIEVCGRVSEPDVPAFVDKKCEDLRTYDAP